MCSLAAFCPRVGAAWIAVIVALFSYLSIEMIAVAAGEAQDWASGDHRCIPGSALLRLVLFLWFDLVLVLAIMPVGIKPGQGAKSPFVSADGSGGHSGAAGIMNFG